MNNFLKTERDNAVQGRQIAFAAAFLLPVGKFLEAPSILAEYASGDLLLPAFFHFVLQGLVLWAVLYAASNSEQTLFQRLQSKLGKGVIALYLVYALFFIFTAILPLLDLEKYIYAAFFDTAPTAFAFSFFFFLSAFLCAKSVQSIARSADLCLFLFLLPFFALMVMALSATDLSGLLPLFGEKFGHTMSAFKRTFPHFSDTIFLLPLLLNYKPKKGDTLKILGGYSLGGAFTLFFLAVFFGIYASIAGSEHYAFSKIGQYFPALSVLGRIDLIFVYLLTIVLLFYTCLPLQYATDLITLSLPVKKIPIAFLLNLGFLFVVLFANKRYNAFYDVISGKLFFVFLLFGVLFPLLLCLLPKKKEDQNAS